MTDEPIDAKNARFATARAELAAAVDAREAELKQPIPGKRPQMNLSDAVHARVRLDSLIDWIWPEDGQGANDESILARHQFEIHYLNGVLNLYDQAEEQAFRMYEETKARVEAEQRKAKLWAPPGTVK